MEQKPTYKKGGVVGWTYALNLSFLGVMKHEEYPADFFRNCCFFINLTKQSYWPTNLRGRFLWPTTSTCKFQKVKIMKNTRRSEKGQHSNSDFMIRKHCDLQKEWGISPNLQKLEKKVSYLRVISHQMCNCLQVGSSNFAETSHTYFLW